MFPVRAADCKTVRSNNSAIAGRGCRKERGLDRCQALFIWLRGPIRPKPQTSASAC